MCRICRLPYTACMPAPNPVMTFLRLTLCFSNTNVRTQTKSSTSYAPFFGRTVRFQLLRIDPFFLVPLIGPSPTRAIASFALLAYTSLDIRVRYHIDAAKNSHLFEAASRKITDHELFITTSTATGVSVVSRILERVNPYGETCQVALTAVPRREIFSIIASIHVDGNRHIGVNETFDLVRTCCIYLCMTYVRSRRCRRESDFSVRIRYWYRDCQVQPKYCGIPRDVVRSFVDRCPRCALSKKARPPAQPLRPVQSDSVFQHLQASNACRCVRVLLACDLLACD